MVRYTALTGFYELEKTIGCGGFAKVKLATHIATGEKVAIKIMEKAALNVDLHRVKLELKALKTLSHPHICKLFQVIETETHYFIVIEYCSGGELFDHIVEKNRLTETESRVFFKQILSAVAYLHSLGYAHRDLKPENILLDKDLNLKLIDFGLCAKPEGGIQNFLVTSCGSPTYAAPELVVGKQYLGPEVDVWAMGVLLYVLLAGFLPFDDENIDNLYKKILRGYYKEPPFMSQGSKEIIRQMLQTDPKRRITVNELLSHRWLTLGVLKPIVVQHQSNKSYDEDCVSLMATYHNVTPDRMWKHLKRWRYDYDTATYFLLLAKKTKGVPMKLHSGAAKLPIRVKLVDPERTIITRQKNMNIKRANIPVIVTNDHDGNITKKLNCINASNKSKIVQSKDANILSPNDISPCNSTRVRKGQKRYRSPNTDIENSPVPAKKPTTGTATPRTPERKRQQLCVDTTGSARKVLGSIERSLNRVKNVLTPKKPTADVPQHPVMLTNKDLLNVSTTQSTDPEFVLNELLKALQKKDIQCERKGLRGKMEPKIESRLGGCSFELEICYIPSMNPLSKSKQSLKKSTKSTLKNGILSPLKMNIASESAVNSDIVKVGIRRKRLKGDSWCYKKVCEQVLALTATELKQPTESSV